MNQREKIIRISSRLMSQNGYKGTSIQEIADLVGIHKTTFFHYFKNKEELLVAIVKIGIHENLLELENIVKNMALSPEEKLKQAISAHLTSLTKYQNSSTIYLSEGRFLSQKNKKEYFETRKHYSSYFEEIVKGLDSPKFKGLDKRMVTFGIMGMLNWVVRWYKKSGQYSIDDIADIFYQMIIK
ncbi:TetR/AcrR family transcriptional regulator [Thermodesulfobacteriota bacterium]